MSEDEERIRAENGKEHQIKRGGERRRRAAHTNQNENREREETLGGGRNFMILIRREIFLFNHK